MGASFTEKKYIGFDFHVNPPSTAAATRPESGVYGPRQCNHNGTPILCSAVLSLHILCIAMLRGASISLLIMCTLFRESLSI